jgi:hypothetical protein
VRRKKQSPGEQDAFTSWRKVYAYLQRPGVVKSIKRGNNKRERREAKNELWKELD